jgi:dipeptidyl aminopeptidase/acylaminoacyl peptidase
MYVGNVTTPTRLMTGEDDLRTPISQTEAFYSTERREQQPRLFAYSHLALVG